MRFAVYAGTSTALATAVVVKAFHQRPNVYSACIYLSQSYANLMILTNMCLLFVGFSLYQLQRLMYGQLRPIETEQLYEKAWFAVTETCLAMTIFRGELGGWFFVMFVSLLVGKVWGWIGEGRVEVLEQQPPAQPRLFHIRLALSLVLAVLFNTCMLQYAVKTVLQQARPDMMVMFGFEFAILSILSVSTAMRYGLSLVDFYVTQHQRRIKMDEQRVRAAETGQPVEDDEAELDVPGWEEKGRWIFYLDLATDFFKLVVYVAFFAILFTFYGLPIHILRDMVLTVRSFAKRIVDFVRYRNATRDMNERYADATAAEISREDVCIICREEMRPWQGPEEEAAGVGQPGAGPGAHAAGQINNRMSDRLRPKKLPCGHILHFACLRSWLERQQNCPMCRRSVTQPPETQGGTRAAGGAANAPAAHGAGGAAQRNQQAHAAGEDNAHGDPGAGGDAGGRPRAWVLNLGPLRIGFGAGRQDQMRHLAQQMQPGGGANGDNGGGQNGGNDQGNAFHFGFGRVPMPQQLPPLQQLQQQQQQQQGGQQYGAARFQAPIQALEQQISDEIASLRASAEQLQIVRVLQSELTRLRAVQATAPVPAPTTGASPTPGVAAAPGAATMPGATNTAPGMTTATTAAATAAAAAALANGQAHSLHQAPLSFRQFQLNAQVPPIGAGDPRLPAGLTLPPGWTLVPLPPVQPGQAMQTQGPQGQQPPPTAPPQQPTLYQPLHQPLHPSAGYPSRSRSRGGSRTGTSLTAPSSRTASPMAGSHASTNGGLPARPPTPVPGLRHVVPSPPPPLSGQAGPQSAPATGTGDAGGADTNTQATGPADAATAVTGDKDQPPAPTEPEPGTTAAVTKGKNRLAATVDDADDGEDGRDD